MSTNSKVRTTEKPRITPSRPTQHTSVDGKVSDLQFTDTEWLASFQCVNHQSPTNVERWYDEALTTCQEYDTDENREALHWATVALDKDRRRQEAIEKKMLRELNKNREQGRTKPQVAFSTILATAGIGLAIFFAVWLMFKQGVFGL